MISRISMRLTAPCRCTSSLPISFLAIRLSESFIHPTVFTRHGPDMAGSQFATFCVAWAAILSLAYFLYRFELAGKRLDANLKQLRELLA